MAASLAQLTGFIAVQHRLNPSRDFPPTQVSPLWIALERAVALPTPDNLACLEKLASHQLPCGKRANLNRLKTRDDDQCPLSCAAGSGVLAVVEILLRNGALVDGNKKHASPLQRVCYGTTTQHLAIARMLLEHGANIQGNAKRHEYSPLHLASSSSFAPLVELLLDHGADPNALADNATTPLLAIYWASSSAYDCAKLLLERGADPRAQNEDGVSVRDQVLQSQANATRPIDKTLALVELAIADWNARELGHATKAPSASRATIRI